MDINAIQNAIRKFVEQHKTALYAANTVQTATLELGATIGVAEHYRSNGYSVEIQNPRNRQDTFVVKTSTKGHPSDYSRIHLTKDNIHAELHMNLSVRSAHEEGIYCVDVGIVKPHLIPTEKKSKSDKWVCLENGHLISFAEVKKLAIFPMLLAQFVGIAHEIKPAFIGGRIPYGFKKQAHLAPCLISLGRFSGNSQKIVDYYRKRKINIEIYPNYDIRIAKIRGGSTETPFYKGDLDEGG